MKRNLVALLIGATLALSACGGAKDSTKPAEEPAVESAVVESVVEESVTQESVVSEESVQESVVEEAADPDALPDGNPLKGIAEPAVMRVVYKEIDDLMNETYLNSDLATETDQEKVRAAEDALKHSGKFVPWRVVTISLDGEVME